MSPHPLTTICICTRRRPEELGRTLTSLSRSTHLADQVVVSDDGHDEATEQVCRAAPVAVEYVLGPQRGLGANRNRAMAAARGDLILFLDDDCLLGPDFLELALACVADHERRHGKGRVIVSGAVLDSGHTVTAGDQTFLGFQSVPYGSDEGLRSIVISAALIPAMVCEEVKFDPLLVYGYEEVDFASRAAARGYLVVNCPGARNDHRPSSKSRENYAMHQDASRLHVTLRRYLLTERAPLRAGVFALVAPVHLVASSVKRAGFAGLRAALATLLLTSQMLWRSRKPVP